MKDNRTHIIQDQREKLYIVMGPPRSGTSYLSQLLYDDGVKMYYEDNHTFQRHFENQRIVELTRKLLDGESVSIPEYLVWTKGIERAGWKTPDFTLVSDKVIPEINTDLKDIYLFCTVRNPEDSARSWEKIKNDGKTHEERVDWIRSYYRKMIKTIQEFVGI